MGKPKLTQDDDRQQKEYLYLLKEGEIYRTGKSLQFNLHWLNLIYLSPKINKNN